MPDDVTGAELDRDVRAELRSLGTEYARIVARHLVAAHRYLDSDPELAWRHAMAARKRAARLGVVREAAGLAAYRSGRFAEALAELRTARRLTGSSSTLPVMADSERGLGRPDRALELSRSPEARTLDLEGRIELLIVAAGARADLGQPEAAVVALQVPELQARTAAPWLARLRYAYAQALAAAGREQEAVRWRARAAEADPQGVAGITEDEDDDEMIVLDLLEEGVDEGAVEDVQAVDGVEDDLGDGVGELDEAVIATDSGSAASGRALGQEP